MRRLWWLVASLAASGCFDDPSIAAADSTSAPTTTTATAASGSRGTTQPEGDTTQVDDSTGATTIGASSGTNSTTGDTEALCGNGRLDPDEICDDGNDVNQDGCQTDCTASTGVRAVEAGAQHTCALYFDGTIRCWGQSMDGRLGHGGSVDEPIGDNEHPSTIPTVPLMPGADQIALGSTHACARWTDGEVRCWGASAAGQLGYGTTDTIGDNETANAGGPVDVGGPTRWIEAGHDHTCAILESGNLRCWGDNQEGLLGYNQSPDEPVGDDETPATQGNVPLGGREVVSVSCGTANTCAVFVDGNVRCWGSDVWGQLGAMVGESIGDNETADDGFDIDLGGAAAVSVAAGGSFACALTDAQQVYCWGRGNYGQMGNASQEDIGDNETPGAAPPVDLGDAPVVEVAAGTHHVCVRTEDGDVRCWGRNNLGQLGLGSTTSIGDNEVPADTEPVAIGGRAVDLDCSVNHCCVVLDTGGVRCWGPGLFGRLGYANEDSIGDNELPQSAGDVSLDPR